MTGPRLIACTGIAESTTRHMLSPVLDRFPDTETITVKWDASYGPFNHAGNALGGSFKHSLLGLEKKLRALLDVEPSIVIGFSGGAAGAGNVASLGHPNLVAVGLVADPFAPEKDRKWGVAGQRVRRISVPAIWKSDPNDVICRARPNARLRAFADASEAFSLGDPGAWSADLIDRLVKDRRQKLIRNPFDIPRLWTEFGQDISDVEGYLFRGDHTSYQRRREPNGETYIDNLATWVAQQKHIYEKELVRG